MAQPKERPSDRDPTPVGPLAAGGGSDNIGGMETRVAALESDMKELKADLKALRVDVSYIRGRLDSMPTTLHLLGFVVAIFVAAGLTRYFGA